MKNMKQLLVALIALNFIGSVAAAVEQRKALTRDKTHAGICTDGTLGTLSCYERCKRSGWSGNSVIVNGQVDGKDFRGVACYCNNNTVEQADLSSKTRCGTGGDYGYGAGLSAGDLQVYSMKQKGFVTVPVGKAYDETKGKLVNDSDVKIKFSPTTDNE